MHRAIACKPWHPACCYKFFTWLHIYRAENPGDSGGWFAPPSIRLSEAIRHAPDGPQTRCAQTVRPHALRTPYASLNLMADVARTTHPNHLIRANPLNEFGYPE